MSWIPYIIASGLFLPLGKIPIPIAQLESARFAGKALDLKEFFKNTKITEYPFCILHC